MDSMIQKLKKLDAYPKVNEDFYSRSFSGGLITLVSSLVMFLLFLSEFRLYLHTVTETTLLVDTSRGETLKINFDVTFPAIACSLLSLDAMDIMGEQHFDIKHHITKKRLDTHGEEIEVLRDGMGAKKIEKPLQRHGGRLEHDEVYCGSCYGAEMTDDHCCNTCEDVREAYRKKGWAVTNVDLIDQHLICIHDEAFESRSATFDQILEALKNADLNKVGVYGMGGVGKTTLANKVAEQLQEKENETFKAVVMSTITRNVDLKRIQKEIAEFLVLKLDEETIKARAARLHSRLKQEEGFLVILDDIWDTVNLKEIGIPFGDDHKGSKLLMTSRDLTVFQTMGLEKRNCFRLNVLKDEEAKELFEKKAGPLDRPEIRDIASEVAERCAGLPVLIVTVATALKGRELLKWKDAVGRLKVEYGLELSYQSLENAHICAHSICSQSINH